MRVISVFGGSGFLGTELIKGLEEKKFKIRVFTRNKLQRQLKAFSNIDIIQITAKTDLQKLLHGSEIIIDLVGILHESKSSSFDEIHAKRVKEIISIASSSEVKRFIHVGALGASSNAPSKYLRSKAKGEEFIREECVNCKWTIIKPSIIFGEKDKFVNLFYSMVKYLPIVLLVSPQAKFQPIFVKDVVEIIIKSIDDKNTYNKTYAIGGPKTFSFIEIVKLIARFQKKNLWVLPLGKKLSYMLVRVIEFLPVKIITRDNLKSMSLDNTVKINDAYQFKATLTTLNTYLSNKSSKS